MSEYKIRISAKGFFFNSKDEVILIVGMKVGKNGQKYYAAPGGGVEEGENLKLAVERELLEETGYSGVADKVVYVQDYLNEGRGRQLEVFFIGRIDENKKPLSETDHQFKFFNKDQFSEISFLPDINPFNLRQQKGIDYQTYLSDK